MYFDVPLIFQDLKTPQNAKSTFFGVLCERGGNALFKCGVTSKSIFARLDPFSWKNPQLLPSPFMLFIYQRHLRVAVRNY